MRQEFAKNLEGPWGQGSCKRLVPMVLGGAKKGKGFGSQDIEALVVVAEKVCCQERKGLGRQERRGLGSQKEKAPVEKKEKAWVAKKEKALTGKKEKALTARKERALTVKKEMALVARKKRLRRSKTRGLGAEEEKVLLTKKQRALVARREKALVARKNEEAWAARIMLGGKMLKMAGGANQSQGEKKRETGKGFSDSQTMSRPRNVLGLGEQTS